MSDADIRDAHPLRAGLEEPHNATPGHLQQVIKEVFVPDLIVPDRPFRPGLRVESVTAHPGVFEMTWDGDGRATFSNGSERVPGQVHIIWRRIGTHAIFTPPPGP
jgi:hypothetical protein